MARKAARQPGSTYSKTWLVAFQEGWEMSGSAVTDRNAFEANVQQSGIDQAYAEGLDPDTDVNSFDEVVMEFTQGYLAGHDNTDEDLAYTYYCELRSRG